MTPTKFATPGSGVLAHKIGWFDFGPAFTLVPGGAPIHVINSLPDSYTVEFDINVVHNSGGTLNFTSSPTPTHVFAAFGNTGYTGYTGIGGNVALWSDNPVKPTSDESVNITNIIVKNSKGVPTTTYRWVTADAVTTGLASTWSATTNGSVWTLLDELPPVSGPPKASPIITGVGTTTVLETGTSTPLWHISGPVYISNAPTSISGTVRMPALTRQGYAFGIVITEREQAVSDLIESVALEQTALSHILNAEGEKIQKIIAKGSINQIMKVNKSVENMTKAITKLELILQSKLETVECVICPDDLMAKINPIF